MNIASLRRNGGAKVSNASSAILSRIAIELQKWLKAGYIEKRTLFPMEAGTPQGGVISPTLANMTLDGLEQLLRKHFPRQKWRNGKIWSPKVNLVRYADDFIITGDSKRLLLNEVRPLVRRFLRERGLTLSADKTRITNLACAVAVGQTPTSQEIARLGEEALLPRLAQESLDVCGQNGRTQAGWHAEVEPPDVCGRHSDSAAYKNPARGQPVRPAMADLLQRTRVPEEVWHYPPASGD